LIAHSPRLAKKLRFMFGIQRQNRTLELALYLFLTQTAGDKQTAEKIRRPSQLFQETMIANSTESHQ